MESPTRPRRLFARRETTSESPAWWRPLVGHAWLLPILAIALWLRLAGFAREHLYGDEAEYAIVARYLSRDLTFLAYPNLDGMTLTPFVSQPPLVLYTMAFSMKIFGATDFAAIFPSVLFGVATVAVAYFLGNRLGGRLMGLGAAAIIAVLPFHVEMSRRAMLDVGYAFFLLLAAYYSVAWLQTRRPGHAVGVGVATAGAALSKLPGVLAGPAVLVVLLVALGVTLARRARGEAQPDELRRTLVGGGLGLIPVAVGAFLYLGLLTYLSALQNLWVKLMWQLGRVDTSQAAFNEVAMVHRDASFYFSDPQFGFAAQLTGMVFALALVGMAVALLRFGMSPLRQPEHIVVPVFVLVLLAFFLYSDRKEGFYLLPFAPFAAILVGYSADGLRRLLAWGGLKAAPNQAARLAPAALAIGLVLVAVPAFSMAADSIDEFANGESQEQYFGYGTKEAAQFIHARDPDAAQYGTLLGRFSLHWYNEQVTYHWYIDNTFIENQAASGELRYIVYDEYLNLPNDKELMNRLITKYNGELVETFSAGWGEVKVFELHP